MNRASTGTPGGPRPVHGALPILSISSLMMVAPGAILMRPLGILPALAAAVAVVIALRSPRPEARPLQLGRRGAQWVGASSALEGIVAVGGVLLCLVADQMQWWFPLLLASVALHLTTFLIWARRRIDLLLVPIAWTSAGLAIALTAQGDWRTAWASAGWLMAVVVVGYLLVLATPVANALSGPVWMRRARSVG